MMDFFNRPPREGEPPIVGILKVNDQEALNAFAKRIGVKIILKAEKHDLHTKEVFRVTKGNTAYLICNVDGSMTLVQEVYDSSSLVHDGPCAGMLTAEAQLERARKEGWI